MARDVVVELGYLALGTRLKRLAEQLQAGVAEAIAETGIAVQPSQLVLLIAVRDQQGIPVTELVEAIGVSQPAVSRSLGILQRTGFVRLAADRSDGRTRRVHLTRKGRLALHDLEAALFGKVASAAEALCKGTSLLSSLARIEARNRAMPFALRIGSARS